MAAVKRIALASGVLFVVAGLTGCESFSEGPASISLESNDLLVATCVDIVVTEIYGEAQTAAGLEPFVELSGQIRLPAGSILRSEVVPEGMVGSFGALDLQSLESIVIRFTGPDDEFAAGFGGRGVLTVPTGSWLQTDGTISSTACD